MSIEIRQAEGCDSRFIASIMSDRKVRETGITSDEVQFASHPEWFYEAMLAIAGENFIAVMDGTPIGLVSLGMRLGVAEISYAVAEKERGKGYGKAIISGLDEAISSMLAKHYPSVSELEAIVKADNSVSCHIFEQAGYHVETSKTHNRYRKALA